MNHILETRPRPVCILTTHPARAYIDPSDTDVAKTWAQHTPVDCRDSYERCDQTDYLERMGAFK